jgi:predicted Fe-Mo cluster-binding NifX family protein
MLPGGGAMKIAVTARGDNASSEVDPRFGRASWFVIVDSASGDAHAIDNTRGIDAAHGAGIRAAELVAGEDVGVVITGNCGPNAFRTLSAAGIAVVLGASGTVSAAVEAFKQGRLEPAAGPNASGHGR